MARCICAFCGSDIERGRRCVSCGAQTAVEVAEVSIPDCDPDAPFWLVRTVEIDKPVWSPSGSFR